MKLQTVGELAEQFGFNALVYGPLGSGKTRSILTIPNQGRVLVCASEKGLKSIEKTCKKVKAVTINNGKDLLTVHDNIKPGGKWHGKVETVVTDSLTDVAGLILSDELEKYTDARQAYGRLVEILIKIVKAFIELPVNTIFICHEMSTQTDGGRVFYVPSFPGKKLVSTNVIPHEFDMVFHSQAESDEEGKLEYSFQTNLIDDVYLAKTRADIGCELEPYEPQNWANIYKKLNGGGK